MKNVLFVTNVPSPYRVSFFNELGKFCNLTVFFEKKTSSERDKSWSEYKFDNFIGIVLDGKETSVDSAYCPSIIKEYKKRYFDYIFISNFSSKTGVLFTDFLIRHKKKYYIESDGGFYHKSNFIKHIIKKRIFKNAQLCLSTSNEHDRYYQLEGVNRNKIYRYPFSSVHNYEILTFDKKKNLKDMYMKDLNMNSSFKIVVVGQFIHRKGFDILFDALKNLKFDFKVYAIGGKPTDEYINQLKKNDIEDKVIFVNYKPKEEILKYMTAADLFVMPTREDIWGLVINEALACGAPIISSNRCLSSVEISQFTSGIELYDVNDILTLSKLINKSYLEECNNKIKDNLNIALKYTIEAMVDAHLDIINKE